MKKILYLLTIVFLPILSINAQQVIVTDDASYTTPASGSVLDVKSTSKGFMPPRVELTGRTDATTISSPTTGLMVYNTATAGTSPDNVSPGYYYNSGTTGSPSWTRVMNSDVTNGMSFQSDGTPILNGTATMWDDVRVSLITRGSGGVNPTYSLMQGTLYAYKFSGTQDNNVYFEVQLPHSYKEGTTIYPHVHWATNGSATTNVTWALDYEWQDIGGTFSGTTSSISTDVAASGVVGKQQINNISGITEDRKISSILMCRLYRKGSTDANSDDCFLLAFDIHFEVNTMGSREITTK